MHPSSEIRLARLIKARRGLPFAWGTNDCNTFALECLDLVAGTQLLFEVSGQYSNEAEAETFYASFRLRWDTWDGFTEVAPTFAQTGDLLIVDMGTWCMPHVVIGPHSATCTVDRGVFICRTDAVLRTYLGVRCFRPIARGA